jgi:enoyl-CoA hydratase
MNRPPTDLRPVNATGLRAERVDEEVMVIRIERPHRRNAFDRSTACALEAALDIYEQDDSLGCAVITGSETVFSTGQDVSAASRGDLAVAPNRGALGMLGGPPSKPIIAAVEGQALGGGLALCLACDLIVAAKTATMGVPEAPWSLDAPGSELAALARRIPYHALMELVMTGRTWPAPRLASLGIVNRITEARCALPEAIGMARHVAALGPTAVRASKRAVTEAYDRIIDLTAQDLEDPMLRGLRAVARPLPTAELWP